MADSSTSPFLSISLQKSGLEAENVELPAAHIGTAPGIARQEQERD